MQRKLYMNQGDHGQEWIPEIHHGVPSGLHLIAQRFDYQEDNDPKHSSELCRGYLAKKEDAVVLKIKTWPPQSPIEQIWDLIDQRLLKGSISSVEALW